ATFAPAQVPGTGSYTINAIATNSAGNVSPADTRAVTVDITAPPPPVINVVSGDDIINASEASSPLIVSGTAEMGSSVIVSLNGIDLVPVTAAGAGNGSAPFAPAQIPNTGSYSISATATDPAGNES